VIGENCVIMHQVTIGSKTDGDDAPSIGDSVFVGSGAKILGSVIVGSNSTIGANAVITKNVPSGSTVVGINKLIS
jgi:serine O-acetyltransferase